MDLNTNTNRYECGLQPRLGAEYMNDMKFVRRRKEYSKIRLWRRLKQVTVCLKTNFRNRTNNLTRSMQTC